MRRNRTGAGESDLVALLSGGRSVGVGEVDVAAGVMHHSLYVVAALADDMRMLRVRNLHLECHTRRRLTTSNIK